MDYRARVKKDNSETLYSSVNRYKLECMDLSIANQDERKLVDEVFRIKSILDKKKGDVEYGSWVVYDCLKKLQKMVLSVKILKITMIGCSVSALKKHDFKHVSRAARMLIEEWRRVADEWVAAIEEKTVVNQEQQNMPTSKPQRRYSESVYKLQHMDSLKETAIEKTFTVLQNHVSKDVSETTRTLVKAWKDMVNETTKNESSIVKKISEKADNQKGSITCYQQRKPVDCRVETGDQQGPTRTIIEKNFEASKRKMQTSYKEVECMKKKRKIQLLQLNELPRQDHQLKPVNKRLRR
ncbi:putative mediator of RNA polymerase II transcription subunit 26b [Artemisia annua]|uniref:Putative mediator of RNA polymerase II transcription subunit 26b n=1 Tax=Artemisia annua TaxID=35608 RepID=A0A2U1M5N3_ARTAN|nr:putative mediator of RNA polymerase II transcription subunit 26b [Artemisia annua]